MTPSIIKQVHALAVLDKMPEGLKITNRAKNVIFDSAWIAGVDYDEEQFDDEGYDVEEDDNDNEDDDNDEYDYDKMDKNEFANILQQANEFQIPHETEEPKNEPKNEHEFVFEDAASDADEVQELFEDYDEEYKPEGEEDILLEADDKDGEEEDNQGTHQTGRVRVPPQSWHIYMPERNKPKNTVWNQRRS